VPARTPASTAAIVAAATVLALVSAFHSGGHVWRLLGSQRETYAPLNDTERRRLPLEQIGVPGAVFDFYASYIVPGDRLYFQVRPGRPGATLDLPAAFAAAGRFYLLPGVQTENLADATVVISYFENPSDLHIPFTTQRQDGQQPVYVSRIRAP
jgi:hypothetical protein